MIDNVYKIDNRFPDPYEVRDVVNNLSSDSQEYKTALKELKSSGLSQHPLLRQFFVES